MTSQEGGRGKTRLSCHHLSAHIGYLFGRYTKVLSIENIKNKVRKPGNLLSTLTAGDHTLPSLVTELTQILFLKMSWSSLV